MAKQKKTAAPAAPASDAQHEMRRLMSAGWTLSHIAKAVGISSGAAAVWVKGGNATDRFLLPLRALPSTPPTGKPAVNKLDAPKAAKAPAGAKVSRRAKRTKLADEGGLGPADLEAAIAAGEQELAKRVAQVQAGTAPAQLQPTAQVTAEFAAPAVVRGSRKVSAKDVAAFAAALKMDPLELLERMGQLRFEF